MTAYYNEIDPFCAEWLRHLMDDGQIPGGEIDTRSITDVSPDDLSGFSECHFFAGIGGWPLALRLAGWGDQPVWTGSAPCQPFSSAGKREGCGDERHLWPEFYRLIQACRPPVIFGEQVASSEVVGTQLEAAFVVAVRRGDYARANLLAKRLVATRGFHSQPRWLDGVFADLESAHYTCWTNDLPAACVGAPHIRQRLFWVADAERDGGRLDEPERGPEGRTAVGWAGAGDSMEAMPRGDGRDGVQGGSPDRCEAGRDDGGPVVQWQGLDEAPENLADGRGRRFDSGLALRSPFNRLAHAEVNGRDEGQAEPDGRDAGTGCDADRLGNANGRELPQRQEQPAREECAAAARGGWADYAIVHCRDSKARRVPVPESGIQPLAYGIPRSLGPHLAGLRSMAGVARRNRVGRLRGYGNAITPQVAAEFVTAYLEARG